jgi:hypothetical protein
MRFDSKAEAQRWHCLTMRQKAGEITDLKHHVHFDLLSAQDVNGRKQPSRPTGAVGQQRKFRMRCPTVSCSANSAI